MGSGGRSADIENLCNTLASWRCWPTTASCISSRRNILTEHVGSYQKTLYRRTFLSLTATTRCFIQASCSSRLPTEISHVLGLTTRHREGKPQINAYGGWCWKTPPHRCPAMRTQTMHGGSSPSRLNSPPPLASPLASPLAPPNQDRTASSRSGSERPRSQLDEPRPVTSKEVPVLGEIPAASVAGNRNVSSNAQLRRTRCGICVNPRVLNSSTSPV